MKFKLWSILGKISIALTIISSVISFFINFTNTVFLIIYFTQVTICIFCIYNILKLDKTNYNLKKSNEDNFEFSNYLKNHIHQALTAYWDYYANIQAIFDKYNNNDLSNNIGHQQVLFDEINVITCKCFDKIISCIKLSFDKELKRRECYNEESQICVCIKQLNHVYIKNVTPIDRLEAYAVRRDARSYAILSREIYHKSYLISANTSLIHCINTPRAKESMYYNNDLHSAYDNGTYHNERGTSFKSDYKASAVMPIFAKCNESKIYFGYLALDSMNTKNSNIFEKDFTENLLSIYSKLLSCTYLVIYNYCSEYFDNRYSELYNSQSKKEVAT